MKQSASTEEILSFLPAVTLLADRFMLVSYGGHVIARNIGCHSTDHTELQRRRTYLSITVTMIKVYKVGEAYTSP
jgi:hypothetical protein